MFDDDGNLSPDLEWMLQSEQIKVDSLIETLVTSYYQHIYSLALSRLSYPEEAHRAAQDSLIQVITQKMEFRGDTNVTEWIGTISSRIIAERLSNIKKLSFLNPRLISSIRAQQPGDTLSDRQIQFAIIEIKSKVKGSRISRSNWAYLQLIGLTCFVIFVAYFLFNPNNPFFTDKPGDLSSLSDETSIHGDIESPLSFRGKSYSTRDIPRGSIVEGKLPPLTTFSSSREINERIQLSSQQWKTMWADITVNFYGPAGYVGPPHSERHQLWIDQVGGAFQIIGPPQGIPDSIEQIILSHKNSPTWLGFSGTTDYAKLGSQFPWFSIKTETVFLFPFAINYLFNTIDQDFFLNASLSVIGKEIIADRESVIIGITSPENNTLGKIWLDTQIGIILKEQYYDPLEFEKVIIESSLRRFRFDDSTPTRSNRPENSTQAPRDHLPELPGLPEQTSSNKLNYPMLGFQFRSPPSNFDLSQSRISFVKAERAVPAGEETGEYHIFADDYFLGDIEMINPLRLICDRSLDGSKLVLSEWFVFPTDVTNNIYLFDLHEASLVRLDIPNTIIYRVSFSPDNASVIAAGYEELDGQNKFYLINTTTGDYELLPIQTGFGNVTWSPDGSEIAVLDLSFSPTDFKSSPRIRVFDVKTGVEKRRFSSKQVSQGAPKLEVFLDGWTAEFHSQLQDISLCSSPP
jgi:hypothetical protein